jgi:hypothetical protein
MRASPTLRKAVAATILVLAGCAAPSSTPPTGGAASMAAPMESLQPSAASSAPARPRPTPSAAAALAWHELGVTGPIGREDHTWTLNADGTVAYLFGGRALPDLSRQRSP